MVVWDDSQLRPAINNRQQTQVIVRGRLFTWAVAEREPVQNLIFQQKILAFGACSENRRSCIPDSALEFLSAALNHELVKVCHRFRILADLCLCCWVKNGKAGINVPFVCVDAQSDVDLDVFDTSDPTGHLPGELLVCVPCSTHAKERRVCNRLGVCGNAIVHFTSKVDILRTETRQDILDEPETLIRRTMLDEDLREKAILLLCGQRHCHSAYGGIPGADPWG